MSIHPSYFREVHKGETVFILGNGPSLLEWTMPELRELGGVVIGINKSWMGREANEHGPAHPGVNGADYHCFVSGNNVEEVITAKVDITTCLFVPSDLKWALMRPENQYRGKWCAIERKAGGTVPGVFRNDVSYGFDANFAGYFALQIAAYMDFHTICLIGYDCVDRQGHHWDSDPYSGVITRHQMIPWIGAFAVYARARPELRVFNCSEKSAIPFFPRVPKREVADWLKHGAPLAAQ